ncbi:MAG: PAS domain S-box protein [Methylotenera sp.]|nr:PAS domain S-box protein [Methylotenera sp.]
MQTLINLLGPNGLIPHGYCLSWNPGLLWLHVLSDTLIVLAYYSIPLTILYFIKKRKDLPFQWIFVMSSLFILACGTTHLLSMITIWHPIYGITGIAKAVTAIISVFTAISMFWIIPRALALPSSATLEAQIQETKQAKAKLQTALNTLQKIADRVPGMVFQYRLKADGTAYFPFASEAIRQIYRVSPDEVHKDASKIFSTIHPNDLNDVITSIQTSAQELTTWHHEFRVKFEDGTINWLLVNAVPEREADGSTLWHGFISDISEQKRIELQVLTIQQHLQATLSAIPDILLELGLDGHCYNIQSQRPDLLTATPDEFIGKTVQEILPAAPALLVMSALQETHEYGRSQGKQFDIQLPQGTFWFELSVAKKINDHNQNPRFIVLSRDITERKQTEIELRIAATAFESQEGIMVTDANKEILRVNQAFTKITGYSTDEVVGYTPRLLSSGRQDADFYTAMWTSIKNTGGWNGEIWNQRKNNEIYPAYLVISEVKDSSGIVTNYVASLTDITLRKAAAKEIETLADEVALRDTLVREVHHRIKNNLNAVTGVLSQFAENHPEVNDLLNQAISQVQSIAIVHGLQGRSSLLKVQLYEIMLSIVAEIEMLWKNSITVDVPNNWLPYNISKMEAVPLALILNELITNAIKHGHKDKHVRITLDQGPRPDSVMLSISNVGSIPVNLNLKNKTFLGTGLQLVASLLPRSGATLTWSQNNEIVITTLVLESPIIELKNIT